ncbi:MAG TPA: methytransferase partner Trm112 [Methanoregulaceae archaeon]|nr:methytransferase partner Trm112 [Methanoregulaceae archaeon]
MRRSLLDIICCPVCKGDLILHIVKENESEIVEGTLTCPVCNVQYPILDGIPDLIPRDSPDTKPC